MKKLFMYMFLFFVLFASDYIYGKEIKPGVIINKSNYSEYTSEMQKLFLPGTFKSVISGLKSDLITLPIVETKKYPQGKYFDAATTKYHSSCRLNKKGELTGWKAGIPFPDPETALELMWNVDRRNITTDQVTFFCTFSLYYRGEQERTFRWCYRNYYYTGRVYVPPIPEIPDNNGLVRVKESMLIVDPYDVKDFCLLRVRYEPLDKIDDVYSYIPAIRRIRRLTGSDVCDPVLGSDLMYDDFEGIRQRFTPKMKFKMNKRDMLCRKHYLMEEQGIKITNDAVQSEWEIRPVNILEVDIGDPEYMYSKRIIPVELQRRTAVVHGFDGYDQRGRLMRSQEMVINAMMPKTYENAIWRCGKFVNHETRHTTIMPFETKFADPENKPEVFTFKYLLRTSK
ncbi:MAG: DUF1329 domain-containing protein [Thermodesulfobacteriota bacterium]|nr:DUF1329 domain-containing protein [Thermodesulfobacteriota bacterium]